MGNDTANTKTPPFKDVMGRWRTHSLFRESYLGAEAEADYPPEFTLGEEDLEYEGRILPSMRRLFIEHGDPTGYQFAKAVLGSFEHWKRLTKAAWFRQHLEIWQEELEVKLASEGIRKLRTIAEGDSGQAANAAKFLVDRGWLQKKGRPTKAAIDQAAKEAAGVTATVEEDLERIRLVK